MSNSKFWDAYNEVNTMLKKAFIQMPGGQPQNKQAQDPAAGGMPPPGMDPSMMGGAPMDPSMAGGAPMDPSMAGGMPPPGMDPSMMGGAPMDPSMAGGMPTPPGMDPSMMGGAPTGMEDPATAQNSAPGSPMITISLDQLFEIIQKVLGLAKKVGANGSGIQSAEPQQNGLNADQLKATIYEALGSMAG